MGGAVSLVYEMIAEAVAPNIWQHVLFDKAALNGVVYIATSCLGQLLFQLRRWADDEIPCPLTKRTLASVITNIGVAATIVASGSVAELTFGAAIFMGLGTGIISDAVVGRGKRKVWGKDE